MTDDPGTKDDLPFAGAAGGGDADERQSAPPLDDDGDGVLNPHEDLGQAGTEPDQGPATGPDA